MRRILTLALVCALAPAAFAQRALTLDEALDLARKNNRDLQAARTRLDQSKVGIEQAMAALLPNVAAQGKYTHNYKEVTLDFSGSAALQQQQAQLIQDTFTDLYGKIGQAPSAQVLQEQQQVAALSQQVASSGQALPTQPIVIQKQEQLDFVLSATVPLLVPWAYPGLSAAKATDAANRADFKVTESGLLFQTAQAFFAAAGTDELVIARQHAIEVEQQTLSNAQARLEAGVVNKVEVMRAQLALMRAEQALRESRDQQAQAYRSLATIVQLREPFRVVPEEVPAETAGESIDSLAQQALTLRPEFDAYRRTIDATRLNASSAAWRWAPSLSAFGNVRAFNYAGFSGDQYAWAVGLQLDWVLYDGGLRDAQRHLADAQRHENELRLLQLHDTVRDDLANARQAVYTKRAALETALKSVDLSKQTLDLVRVQHDAGTATQLDLLQAQDALIAAEVSVAQARFDLALSDLSLRRTAGTFPARY